MRRRALASIALVSAAVLIPWRADAAVDAAPYENTAHRGYTVKGAAENTLRAISDAADANATAVEFDVRMLRRGDMILMHDSTLDRTTNCAGRVRDWKWRPMRRQCRTDDGQRVPSLGQGLNRVARRGIAVMVEIKTDGDRWTTTKFHTLRTALAARDLLGRSVVISFNRTYLDRAEAVGLDTMLIGGSVLTDASGYDAVTLYPEAITSEAVDTYAAAGVTLMARASDDPEVWARMWDLGVRGGTTHLVPERHVAIQGRTDGG